MIKSAKLTLAALLAAALVGSASAQITPRPATWTAAGVDGMNSFLSFITPAQQAGFAATGLNIDSSGFISLPAGFTQGTPTASFNPAGGSVNVIFLGESAGWNDDFGYVVNPATSNLTNPGVYNPLVVNEIGSASGTPAVGTLVNNTVTTVNYGPGQKLDFFLNGVGDPQDAGGTWFTFGTPNQFAGSDTNMHTKFENTTIAGVPTLIVAYDDSRVGDPFTSDGDFTDFIIAFQGTGSSLPTPEPSTYGLIGAAGLMVLIGVRRFNQKIKT